MYDVHPFPRALTPEQATEQVGDVVEHSEPNVTDATVAVDADTGAPAFAYLPLGDVSQLRRAVLNMRMSADALRANGRRNVGRTFGHAPRRPVYGVDGCRRTRLMGEHPPEHQQVVEFGDHLQWMLAETFPDVYRADHDTMTQVEPDWMLGETTWTSGVINQSSTLPYHRDGFNFPVWTAMPVLRRHMRGGYLHVPEYDVTVESRDGWAVFFPGYQLVHGVTPMWPTREGGYRYSVVYYALRGMKDCFTYAAEQAYGRKRRTQREQDMARRLHEGESGIPTKSRTPDE